MLNKLAASLSGYVLPVVIALIVGGWGTITYLRWQLDKAQTRAQSAEAVVDTVKKGAEATRQADSELAAGNADDLLCQKGWLKGCNPTHLLSSLPGQEPRQTPPHAPSPTNPGDGGAPPIRADVPDHDPSDVPVDTGGDSAPDTTQADIARADIARADIEAPIPGPAPYAGGQVSETASHAHDGDTVSRRTVKRQARRASLPKTREVYIWTREFWSDLSLPWQ